MTATPALSHGAEQEHFLRTFLKENLRSSGDFSMGETSLETVPFDIWLYWNPYIHYEDVEHAGNYGGNESTVFVDSEQALHDSVNDYAAYTLSQAATYTAVDRVVRGTNDYGFHHDGALHVRSESRNFAWVHTCAYCGGRGHVRCGSCGASGEVACSHCGGRGKTNCMRCGGSGYLTRNETRYVGSQSQTVQVRDSCSCYSGSISCYSCGGRGRVACSTCGGTGRVRCRPCEGTGVLTTVRTMALAATARRLYDIGSNVSSFAAAVLRSYDPAALPTSAYAGSWTPDAKINIGQHQIAYVMHAETRFLASDVSLQGKTFSFRTFGRTLHIADGGGLVEHLLEEDRRDLVAVATQPLLKAAANPIRSVGALVQACRRIVASKINVTLLERSLGDRHSEHVAHSVSAEYERDIVSLLPRALRRVHFSLSTSLWLIAYIAACVVLGLQWHAVAAHPVSSHQFHVTLLNLPYTAGIAAAGFAALTYLASRALPVLPFADKNGATALRCLSLVRGRTRFKAAMLVVGLAVAALAAFILSAI